MLLPHVTTLPSDFNNVTALLPPDISDFTLSSESLTTFTKAIVFHSFTLSSTTILDVPCFNAVIYPSALIEATLGVVEVYVILSVLSVSFS